MFEMNDDELFIEINTGIKFADYSTIEDENDNEAQKYCSELKCCELPTTIKRIKLFNMVLLVPLCEEHSNELHNCYYNAIRDKGD